MRKIVAYFGLLALSSSSLFAALSPYWNSVEKIDTIMHTPIVSDKMNSEIEKIRRVNNLTYEVKTQNKTIEVVLKSEGPEGMGPTKYSVVSVREV